MSRIAILQPDSREEVGGVCYRLYSYGTSQKAEALMRIARSLAPTLIVVFVLWLACSIALAEDWPQWRGPNRDGVWQAENLVDQLPDGQLPLDWSVDIGAGYSGPTVADGRVYVMDRQTADGNQTERILCLDSKTGKHLWKHEYEARYTVSYTAGPRASVTIDEGRAYAVGAMGHFHCLDAASGEVLWQRNLVIDFDVKLPIWGIAASPLIYRDKVIEPTRVQLNQRGDVVWTHPAYAEQSIFARNDQRIVRASLAK